MKLINNEAVGGPRHNDFVQVILQWRFPIDDGSLSLNTIFHVFRGNILNKSI